MNYAILDGSTVKSTGAIQTLFPNTCFPSSGVPTSFLTENNVVELIETLSYTTPSQKLSKVDAYVDSGKVYNVKVESTTTDEQTALITAKWVEVRMERDILLQQTDWRASGDLTLSDDWKTYRQALRDVPTQSDPFNITWPTAPSS
mgnify:CR=1 FL=1|tara:strand:- start:362 stop:799 length:438 start_codon:yes stop_codon:yes gene_type:complete